MVKKVLNVFFGCSMRGGYAVVSREDLAKLPDVIETLGCHIISRHQTQPGIIEQEDALATTRIHDRNYSRMIGSDFGILEISNSSTGVGSEISDMIHLKKPVLCLYQGDEKAISANVRGKEGSAFINTPFECHAYSTLEEAKDIIARFMEVHL
jgi:hypothetical protein